MIRVIISDFYNVLYNSFHREINTEVLEILKECRSKNIPLFLFTNSSLQFLHSENNKTSFLNIFSRYISMCEYNLVKPDSKAFKVLMKEIEYDPKEVVLIDDKEENIEKAREFGFKTIHYIDPVQLRKELNNLDIIS